MVGLVGTGFGWKFDFAGFVGNLIGNGGKIR